MIPCTVNLLVWAVLALLALWVIHAVAEAFSAPIPPNVSKLIGILIVIILVLKTLMCLGLVPAG